MDETPSQLGAEKEVIRNLTKNSYYNLLHRRTDEEIIQEKTNK